MASGIRAKLRRATSIASDARYLPFYLQRRFLNPDLRTRVAQVVGRLRASAPRAIPGGRAATIAQQLLQDGWSDLGEFAKSDQVSAIREHLSNFPISDPYRPELGEFLSPETASKVTHVAFYRADAVASCGPLVKLANSPVVLEALSSIFFCKPTIALLTAWWSLAGRAQPEHAELFHRDVDDWLFIKLFIYLTDVDTNGGAHVYVRSSHKSRELLEIRRFNEQEVESFFGSEQILSITGKAGSAFLENTFGIHRGLPPKSTNRLIAQVVYSLVPLPYGPKKPVLPLSSASAMSENGQSSDLDPYVNRVYFS